MYMQERGTWRFYPGTGEALEFKMKIGQIKKTDSFFRRIRLFYLIILFLY